MKSDASADRGLASRRASTPHARSRTPSGGHGSSGPSRPSPAGGSRAPASTGARASAGRAWGAGTLGAAVALASFLYPPWISRPIGIADYGEYLPYLRAAGSSWFGAFESLSQYYVQRHGRLNLLSYATTALEWTLFGGRATPWYWIRFALMLGMLGMVWTLCRRLQADRWGAAAGASLFLVAGTAWQSWVTINIGEALGTACMLAAALVATGVQDGPRWRTRVAGVAALAVLGLLAKEMLVVLVPFVWGLSMRVGTTSAHFALNRRSLWCGAALASLTLAVGVAVVLVAPLGAAGGYTVRYGEGTVSAFRAARLLAAMALPLLPSLDGHQPVALVGNLAFLGVLWTGLRRGMLAEVTRRRTLAHLVLASTPVLLGVFVYLPWPGFAGSYGLPTLIGPALLLAWAITSLHQRPGRTFATALALTGVALALAGTLSHHGARRLGAELQVLDGVAAIVARLPGSEPLTYLTRDLRPPGWGSPAHDVALYASTVHAAPPRAARERSCQEAHPLVSDAETYFSLSIDCGDPGGASVEITRRYRYLDWSQGRLVMGYTTAYVGRNR